VVEALSPRRNLLMRQDEWRSKSFAANLDQLLIMLAGEPMFSESQLNRALIAAEDAGIRAVLLLNKVDLPTGDLARERLAPTGPWA
jgi:ribosome biogenesis GTPase